MPSNLFFLVKNQALFANGFLFDMRLLLDSCYTWQYLTLDSLEECTTTCRDVRYLIRQTELVDTSYRVTTTDE